MWSDPLCSWRRCTSLPQWRAPTLPLCEVHHDGQGVFSRPHGWREALSTFNARFFHAIISHSSGFFWIRYYGVQATKTFAKLKGLIQEALAKVRGIVKGAIKIMTAKSYRERYRQSSGRDPLLCPHCHHEMDVWKVWHPKYGVVYDELEAMRRGRYASTGRSTSG